ncbi:hypothetical protein HMPREF1981_01902 [Bacteroides pyogenes F0041]|uniref:Uncharacterized protein n=1 Tax=Bacteroides pyogenes F0041 TaxID=1321819 RepID=U2DZB6_9BACE|nr:hypothetical protein HMPREF1981_01902 [Bacteroides pyogenes F0041]GAE24070.1 hypothetical protein JCM10003_3950 [Bacteroides pyogenes JCM 10003]
MIQNSEITHELSTRKSLHISGKETFSVEISFCCFCSTFCSTKTGNILLYFA